MLVLVNPTADGGRAGERWSRVRSEIEARFGAFDECVTRDPPSVRARIIGALAAGERRFVAAGGDGTVNLVLNTLLDVASPAVFSEIVLGAIGLGSSNDFHKPRRPNAEVGGVPCRMEFARALRHDIGHTESAGDDGVSHRAWLLNASVGTTATGNWLFNQAIGLVGWCKRKSATLGMVAACFTAILRTRRLQVTLDGPDGTTRTVRLRNLGVVKNPHFTGCLKYDSPYEPGSRRFFVHLLANSSLIDTFVTLARLARGRFDGRRSASSWPANHLTVASGVPFAVEGDGEVVLARRAEFAIAPQQIWVCP